MAGYRSDNQHAVAVDLDPTAGGQGGSMQDLRRSQKHSPSDIPGWVCLDRRPTGTYLEKSITVSAILPLTYAASLLAGIWQGYPWLAHLGDIAALSLNFVMCTVVASRVFRWE